MNYVVLQLHLKEMVIKNKADDKNRLLLNEHCMDQGKRIKTSYNKKKCVLNPEGM